MATLVLPPTYKEPKIVDYDKDLSRDWYIDYQVYDEDREVFLRRRCYLMNKYTDLSARQKATENYFKEIDAMLKAGFVVSKPLTKM